MSRPLGRRAAFVQASFDAIPAELGLFDGVLCIGNSLSAAGSADAARRAVASMAGRLRPGGRFFIQVLNFARLRAERPAIRGPRARREAGVEYITTRLFSFAGDEVQVTSLTLWNEGGWQKQATCASLYAVSPEQMREWCEAGGLVVEAWSGSYAGEPFDAATSEDLVVVATKT